MMARCSRGLFGDALARLATLHVQGRSRSPQVALFLGILFFHSIANLEKAYKKSNLWTLLRRFSSRYVADVSPQPKITQPRWREGWRVGPSRIAFSKSSATLLVSMASKIIITGLAKVHTFTVNKYHVFLIGAG